MKIKKFFKKTYYSLITLFLIFFVYLIFSPIWREDVHEDITNKGKFLHISDGYLFVKEFGVKSNRPTLVFIHGIGETGENWLQIINLLKPEMHHMITIDIPPSGASILHSSDYNWKSQGRRIREALDIMQIENVILVGHSYGVQAALGALKDLGSRCKGLIVASGITGLPSNQLDDVKNAPLWLDIALKAPILRNMLASFITHPLFIRYSLDTLVYDPKDITPEIYSSYKRAVSFLGINNRFSDWLPEVLTSKDKNLATDNKFFREIKVPTLVLWGDKDKLAKPWQANRFLILIENSKLVIFRDVGHFPHFEESKKFVFEVEQFLNSIY